MRTIHTSPENILNLINQGESESVEFKEVIAFDDIISKHIVAFGNTNGGIILFGVKDKGNIIGIPENLVESGIKRLIRVASNVFPDGPRIGSISIQEKTLLYIVVPPAPEIDHPLMTSHGEIYVRKGESIIREFSPKIALEKKIKRRITVFVAMSFHDEEEPSLVDYYKAMERAILRSKLPIDLKRIDLMDGDYEISQQIMKEIDKSQIIIADFTLNPRNVYFEIGYARGNGDRIIIQTARKGTPLEFDVRNWKTHFYRNATELEEKLLTAIIDAYKKVRK